jgi:hypothetical protein
MNRRYYEASAASAPAGSRSRNDTATQEYRTQAATARCRDVDVKLPRGRITRFLIPQLARSPVRDTGRQRLHRRAAPLLAVDESEPSRFWKIRCQRNQFSFLYRHHTEKS